MCKKYFTWDLSFLDNYLLYRSKTKHNIYNQTIFLTNLNKNNRNNNKIKEFTQLDFNCAGEEIHV